MADWCVMSVCLGLFLSRKASTKEWIFSFGGGDDLFDHGEGALGVQAVKVARISSTKEVDAHSRSLRLATVQLWPEAVLHQNKKIKRPDALDGCAKEQSDMLRDHETSRPKRSSSSVISVR